MRECGMLLPVSSLPSAYGIGAFSKEAYEFVDTLVKAGQKYWQILPLGPTGYGDSPYQSFSAFAGNPYYIDLEELIDEMLLTKEECDAAFFGGSKREVEYDKQYENRIPLLKLAFGRWLDVLGRDQAFRKMEEKLTPETRDYCLYAALKDHFDNKPWTEWEEGIRLRRPNDINWYQNELWEDILFYQFEQFKFLEQWEKLKSYANEKGVKIIGDIPIYVAFDGSDAWSHPELFQFDGQNKPIAVAGCPPDGFSATGQLWGNPLYRWDYHRNHGFDWWMRRMEFSFRLYDVVRVDHFRGFDEYYAIPYGNKTAEIGRWEKGPGIDIFRRMQQHFGKQELPIIAEDLGFLTPSVIKLVQDTGFPGMKILEFAFDPREESDYLPHNYNKNCVVYTGTHDNDTIRGWFDSIDEATKQMALNYMNVSEGEGPWINWEFIRLALASVANLAVIPVQDYLGLGSEARVNTPSTLGSNWKWRMLKGEMTDEICQKARRMARLYGRY